MLCGFLIGREGQVQGNFPLVASYEFLDIPESLASNFRICSFLLKSWDERSSLELLPSEACWDRDAVFIYGFLAAYHITRNRQLLFQVWLPVKWSLKSFSTYKEEATVSPSIKWGDIRCKIDKLCVCVCAWYWNTWWETNPLSSRPRNRTGVSWTVGRFFTSWATNDHIVPST